MKAVISIIIWIAGVFITMAALLSSLLIKIAPVPYIEPR
jgi:hypothetical protein